MNKVDKMKDYLMLVFMVKEMSEEKSFEFLSNKGKRKVYTDALDFLSDNKDNGVVNLVLKDILEKGGYFENE